MSNKTPGGGSSVPGTPGYKPPTSTKTPGGGSSKPPPHTPGNTKPAPPTKQPAPVTAKAPAKPKPLTAGQQNAYDLMTATLTSWGLGSLASVLKQLIVKGDTDQSQLALALSQTSQYKTRFAGNALREKQGLPDLTPAEYIGLEEQYRNLGGQFGLGNYVNKGLTDRLIGNNVSPSEVQTRMQVAHDQYEMAPQYIKDLWGSYFGNRGDAIAAILDPKTATQTIQDRAQQVEIGGAAKAQGLSVSQGRAQQFQEAGVSLDTARKAYQQIATSMPTDQMIAQRFGTTFNQSQEENDLLLNDAAAGTKRQTLYDEEQSLFKGGNSADANTLATSQSY